MRSPGVAKFAGVFGRIVQLAEQTAVINPTVWSPVRVRVLPLKTKRNEKNDREKDGRRSEDVA